VTLYDTDIIYRERMLEAQKEHLPAFRARTQGRK
jgi:hypothetical protein